MTYCGFFGFWRKKMSASFAARDFEEFVEFQYATFATQIALCRLLDLELEESNENVTLLPS